MVGGAWCDRLLVVECKQAGLGLGDQVAGYQALEFGAHAFDVLRFQAEVECVAEVFRAYGCAGVGEGGQDVLVGGVVVQSSLCRRFGVFGPEVEQDLAGDRQVGQIGFELRGLGDELLELTA